MDFLCWIYHHIWNSIVFQHHCKLTNEALWIFRYIDCIIRTDTNHNGSGWIYSIFIIPQKNHELSVNNQINSHYICYSNGRNMYSIGSPCSCCTYFYFGRRSWFQYYSNHPHQLWLGLLAQLSHWRSTSDRFS